MGDNQGEQEVGLSHKKEQKEEKSMSRFKEILLLVILLVLSTACQQSSHFSASPYLQSMSRHSVDICFQSKEALEARVLYGTSQEYGREIEVMAQEVIGLFGKGYPLPRYDEDVRYVYCGHRDDLESGTPYHYKVVLGCEETDDRTFFTAPDPGEPFSFVVYGDSRSNPLGRGHASPFHKEVVTEMLDHVFDLYVHTGDIVHDGYDVRLWENYFGIAASISDRIPFFPAIGNHEDRSRDGIDGREIFETLFSNPTESSGREAYYSFDYGNCHFTMITTEEDISEGSVQNEWIRADIEAAKSDPEIDFTFMAFHRPPYTSAFPWGGEDEGELLARQYLVPIAEEYEVDIVFNGHEHCYERSVKDGVTYITTGNGGALPSFLDVPCQNPHSVYFEPNADMRHFGFCLVHVDGSHLTLESIIVGGEVIDLFEIG